MQISINIMVVGRNNSTLTLTVCTNIISTGETLKCNTFELIHPVVLLKSKNYNLLIEYAQILFQLVKQ